MTNGGYPQGQPPGAPQGPPPGAPQGPSPAMPPPQQQAGMPGFYPPEDIESGKTWALLGYIISPIWIVPLVQRDNAFALFHAKQALMYMLVMMIASIPATVIGMLTCGVGTVIILPLMYPWIMAIVYSAQGQYRPMPWFGHLAEKYFGNIVADKRPVNFNSPYRGYPGAPPQ